MAKPDDKKDDKKGAKAAAGAEDIMSKGDIKAALALARRGSPANCAIGMTRDKEGIILLDKKIKGKKLRNQMKDVAAKRGIELDTTSIRFGKASVDTDTDATLVTFIVNKDAPGAMRMPLLSRLKEAGFSKIVIMTDPNLENEPEQDDPVPVAPATTGAEAAQPAAAAAAPKADAAQAGGTQQGSGQEDAEKAARLKQLTQTLGQLFQQIPAVLAITPTLKASLVPIAEAANTALRDGKADIAADLIETLADELKAAPTKDPSNAKAIADKAQLAWDAYLKIAAREVEKLRAEVTSAYRDHGFGSEVDKFFKSQIDPALKRLESTELTTKLAAAGKSTDATERRKLLTEGVKIVEGLEGLVASDPVLKKLDDNPFTELVIAKTAAATLGTLKKTLQSAVRI
jgi:hypothetical protein